jgi:hypothetical protein
VKQDSGTHQHGDRAAGDQKDLAAAFHVAPSFSPRGWTIFLAGRVMSRIFYSEL